jgi:prepilin-type N-terminal cleavage/methylation domain-containing protein
MEKNSKNKRGFTLLEVLIAVSVLVIGAVAAFSTIASTIRSTTFAKDKLIASFLAQEGIEIVKNIRNTNWIQGNAWNQGLSPGSWQADYNDPALSNYNGAFLNLGPNGYSYDPGGTSTKFQRKITITQISSNELKVKVEVFWQGHTYEVTSIITNWWQ